MTEERNTPSVRETLIEVVRERLLFQANYGSLSDVRSVAALVVDDIMASSPMALVINRGVENGIGAGYEKALRDSIAAVAEVPRSDRDVADDGEPRLIPYQEAQRRIAQLSKRGLEEIWESTTTPIRAEG